MAIDQIQRIRDLDYIQGLNPNNPWGKGLIEDYNLKYGEECHIGPEEQGRLNFEIEVVLERINKRT